MTQPLSQMTSPETLQKIANQLRIDSIRSTTAAGSGHPTSCCSAADLMAALFFHQMRYNPSKPRDPANDRFVLSKGHAAPLLYSAWAEAGNFDSRDLERLRTLDSPLEGHPTPRLDFVDVATGSLGQGLSAGVGMALNARLDGRDYNTYVLLGDGELAEGSVWEAASLAGIRGLHNLVALVDVNRLGQSQATAFGHDVEIYRSRFEAFGWEAVSIDGHDIKQILETLARIERTRKPLAIIARTIKGKGIPFAEDQLDWHGKALSREQASQAIEHLAPRAATARSLGIRISPPTGAKSPPSRNLSAAPAGARYQLGQEVATRKAFGNALASLGAREPRVVVVDGDVENSTYTNAFAKLYPDRFIECFISEQNMVGISVGLSALGKIPFSSTFAAFFTRAADQIRMAAVSLSNIKMVGTHAGVSIGEDGPSQMGLEDLALMRSIHGSVVLCPSDAVSAERLVEKMAGHQGIAYLRTARPETPVLYSMDEEFEIGGAKLLRQSEKDQLTVVATGVTVIEALKAHDLLAGEGISLTVIDAYSIKPLASDLIRQAMARTRNLILTVEDHYPEGGLGDAIAGELSKVGARVHKLAIYELPHSGKREELMARYRIDANAIAETARELINGR